MRKQNAHLFTHTNWTCWAKSVQAPMQVSCHWILSFVLLLANLSSSLSIRRNRVFYMFSFSKRAGTANLKDKRLQNMILTIFKCLHFSDYPIYLKDMFRLRSSTYFLRGHNMLCLPKPLTTSYGINSFSYLAAKSWNSLPDHYRTITDCTSFRRLISTRKKWFCIFFSF